MIVRLLRTKLALRSTALILLIVVLVGAAFLAGAIAAAEHNERDRQHARLTELLDTVENTVGIAAFLGDQQLAREVANGLLKNRTVNSVVITAGNHQLASVTRTGADSNASAHIAAVEGVLVRKITSPFDSKEIVGSIRLVPNEVEIRHQVALARQFVTLLLTVLAACIAAGTVLVVVRLITRPITLISARLHQLHAETGEKLEFPRGNEKDEIGRLVSDVNALIDYLVNILTDERRLRIEREVEERKFRAIFDNAETGIFQIDSNGTLTSWNPAFARFFDIPRNSDEAREQTFDLFSLAGENGESARRIVHQCTHSGEVVSLDMEIGGHGRRRPRWVNIVLTPIEHAAVQGIVNDITERKRAEMAARELAITDALTSLGNRLGFERRLRAMIDASTRDPQRRFALLLMDLDLFKQVNDTWGHQAGDEVLRHVAQILRDVSRKTDYAARLGGDEFILLLDGIGSREVVIPILKTIFSRIHQPIPLANGASAVIGVSIGAAIFAPGEIGEQEFFKRADEAMYQAKEGGRNAWCFAGDKEVTAS